LDVPLNSVSICIVEADGKLVWQGKVLCEPEALILALSPYRDGSAHGAARRGGDPGRVNAAAVPPCAARRPNAPRVSTRSRTRVGKRPLRVISHTGW